MSNGWARQSTGGLSDLRVKIKKRIQALLQLGLDLPARTLNYEHCDVCFVSIHEFECCIVDLCHFALGQEPHSVDQSQICHVQHLI